MMMIVRKIKEKLAKWVMKDIPIMQSPIQPIIIENNNLKKFHAQHLVDWFEWKNTPFTPDCFVKGFKYQLVNELLNEIIIKVDETPEGVCYSADLLFRNI